MTPLDYTTLYTQTAGEIIVNTNEVEHLMDLVLTRHVADKQAKKDMDRKIATFKKLLPEQFPQVLKKNPDILKRMEYFQKLRSHFAHSYISVPDDIESVIAIKDVPFLFMTRVEKGNVEPLKYKYPFTHHAENMLALRTIILNLQQIL